MLPKLEVTLIFILLGSIKRKIATSTCISEQLPTQEDRYKQAHHTGARFQTELPLNKFGIVTMIWLMVKTS